VIELLIAAVLHFAVLPEMHHRRLKAIGPVVCHTEACETDFN